VKKVISWTEAARAELRKIDRDVAVRILASIDRYVTTEAGDVKQLQPPFSEYRLRVGDYRVFFERRKPVGIVVTHIKHRSEAYG
jgi:mRNA-degrading endonuclease RelE of RelBE toxin-antitoxin system